MVPADERHDFMKWLLKAILGTKNERDLKKLRPLVARINELEKGLQSLSDDEVKAKTGEFRERLEKGETLDDLLCEAFAVVKNACRRLCGTVVDVCGHPQTWNMVPFDTQLIGGIALHQGKIAEMATGEGKTLVATLPVYLNALSGKGVHVVTVNDYLAKRDSEWMGTVYKWLGLTVGCIQNSMLPPARREQYACDITYGTNSEFGFDYLRDMGMAYRPGDMVQRGWNFALVDEVDSILIDEARTPLIISGPVPEQESGTKEYQTQKSRVARLVENQRTLCTGLMAEAKKALEEGDEETAMKRLYQVSQGMPKNKQLLHLIEDAGPRRLLEKVQNMMLVDMNKEQARSLREELYFVIDEKGHDASLTEKGCNAMNPQDPDFYVVPDLPTHLADLDADTSLDARAKAAKRQKLQERFVEKSALIHAVDQLIRAYSVYERDVQYVVQDGQVVIVDEFTGRLMPGRRWSDGLHQAVEAKEGVQIRQETQTFATITIQNYFRMYSKLAGMTGTAETDADEFMEIYKMDVLVIPTNRPVRRVDLHDRFFRTRREKLNAIVEEISNCYRRQQPVLVGTVSVEKSEVLSRMLKRANIPHKVLNAKLHQKEAEIVAEAGRPGQVTIATNMAGRGTDIKLGDGVVWVDRAVLDSQAKLSDKPEGGDGKTLEQLLLERPCGLYVIGTERHESRRIDRQLRGRCARQGDPGMSCFFVSLEDDLMRLFGSDRISNILQRLGWKNGEMLEHGLIDRTIETSQRKMEERFFAMRKHTLEYDDVMNKQREVVYGFRSHILALPEKDPEKEDVRKCLMAVVEEAIAARAEAIEDTEESIAEFVAWVNEHFLISFNKEMVAKKEGRRGGIDAAATAKAVFGFVGKAYEEKCLLEDPARLPDLERRIMLSAVDQQWQEYLRNLDVLRQGVMLRAFGQRDPLVEYKNEAYTLFSDLMDRINDEIARGIFLNATNATAFENILRRVAMASANHAGALAVGGGLPRPASRREEATMEAALADIKKPPQPIRRDGPKINRNDPCPCGSGKKYKKCCGDPKKNQTTPFPPQ